MPPIYLDHCATTPIEASVLDAMLPFLREAYGNPDTPHQTAGGFVKRAVESAREQVASLIKCRANELIWTSGATEANNLAILGIAESAPHSRRHLVTQVTEHSSVLEPCSYLARNGWDVTFLAVDEAGRVDADHVQRALREDTALVTVMWGNNEIGTIQPLQEIADLCASRDVPFHCDAAQAAGKVMIDVEDVRVAMITLSAHKMYGPKGVGALYIRDLHRAKPIVPRAYGGGQEKGLRSGTLNVPAVVGFGAACDLATSNITQWGEHTAELRDRFEQSLMSAVVDCVVNGCRDNRLPHISNVAFPGTDSEGLLTLLPGIVASTGSACHTADFAPSHVLEALPGRPGVADCSLRFGFGKDNTGEHVAATVDSIRSAVMALRTA